MKRTETPTIYNIEILQTRKDTIENFLKLAVIGMFESKDYDMNDGEVVFKAFVTDLKNSIDCPTPLANFCAGLLQGLKEVDKKRHAHQAARNIKRKDLKMKNWIDIKDALPPIETTVIVADEMGNVWSTWASDEDGVFWFHDETSDNRITHWMPCPAHPLEQHEIMETK